MVVLIVGDMTAQVGDPSGRSELRPMLSAARRSRRTRGATRSRRCKILRADPESLEVRRNSEWLEMDLPEMLELLATTTSRR